MENAMTPRSPGMPLISPRRTVLPAVALLLLAACAPAAPLAAPTGPTANASAATSPATSATPPAPVTPAPTGPATNAFWWPERLDLSPLRQHGVASDPLGADFDYGAAFESLDLGAVKKDISATLTQSQAWGPADYGTYAPFFIRMAWHSAGTYRVADGRGGASGGQQRFEPLNSWPDNTNLDKARRLLWPVKQKYGNRLSWADLMVLAGNVALESMGFKTYGFAGGRRDQWEADLVNWGPEHKFLADERRDKTGAIHPPLAAVQMGLIYVNPEGPGGKPDPLAAAADIRTTFGRMAMDDEETVALIAGGHSFGKAHGAADPSKCIGPAPAANGVEAQGMGWKNRCGTGVGGDTITSGLEGAWTSTPTQWSIGYLANLFQFEWEQTKSPGGAIQWQPTGGAGAGMVPDAHDPKKSHAPMMFTTDIALKLDPSYEKLSRKFLADPKAFEQAFGRAWFKLTHRDMGPRARYRGAEIPKEELAWQDPLPPPTKGPDAAAERALRSKIAASGLTNSQLVKAAWASAATFRGTDRRGGANGGRVRLAQQRGWAVNDPKELATVLDTLEKIRADHNKGRKPEEAVSAADVIVLAGTVGVERAAKAAGVTIEVPFQGGRADATEAQTDATSFAPLEPKADAFRNYYSAGNTLAPLPMLVERANYLTLSVPEMTALLGGLRAIGANSGGTTSGLFTTRPGTLSNDFFTNLLTASTRWEKGKTEGLYEGYDRATGKLLWTATPVDLVFGSHAELRAVAEVYGAADGNERLVRDFVRAWTKVMNLDRFDLTRGKSVERGNSAKTTR